MMPLQEARGLTTVMFAVRPCRVPWPRRFCRSLTSYSPKVYAYPFKLSSAQAVAQLDPIVGGSFLRPELQMQKIVPVYFPAWFIDAEVEASVLAGPTALGAKEGRVTVIFNNSYLPGHTMSKLSSISLLSKQLERSRPIPFSPALGNQYDTEVTCLPFKTTPFAILDAVKSLRPDDCVWNNLRIDPSSIHTNLISAYPVLMPLYLAQYASAEDGTRKSMTLTAIVEANHEHGRIIVENFIDPDVASVLPAWMLPDLDEFRYHGAGAANFANISTLTLPPEWNAPEFGSVANWLDTFLTAETLQELVDTDAGKMDDLRIRPFNDEEATSVRTFFRLGEERAEAHTFLNESGANPLQEVKDYTASFDTHRENALPKWWKDWQKSVTEKTKPT
ncbi:hypothetical protein B0H15DRAFT_13595 [Mycena belliarum]|uniref:Uncharacterized protein n=1 Tax=Mycena belliarum TaxID=1033014 RepID=A0AAD6Y285_9AGAR|nr:hypothetical protein B0H15DRAFT_13595 [Mycena belliae]